MEALYQRIAQSIANECPAGWARAEIHARMLDGITELEAYYFLPANATKGIPVYAGNDADRAFEGLRKQMAKPGKGAWYSAHFIVFANGKFDVRFDYDSKPRFSDEPAAQWFIDDLKVFPRDPANVPKWMPTQP